MNKIKTKKNIILLSLIHFQCNVIPLKQSMIFNSKHHFPLKAPIYEQMQEKKIFTNFKKHVSTKHNQQKNTQ